MDIMLTISYSLKIPRDAFFQPENGCVQAGIRERLNALFPSKITLTEGAVAKREHLVHYPLEEGKNALRCASCGKWLYVPGKETLPVCLEYGRQVKGIPLCPSCAWELNEDLKDEEFVRKLTEAYSGPATDVE